ncbi:MAG: Rpn family recombination-promoting nuclease/putative transposase [Alphaproteobacteria bacterium]|nr:Rpn family recombination-promoting nuclease/putative transposase [Alphaproteobacteria bacterium]
MSLPSTPHDALFRALVSHPARASALLADYLPREVADLLDPSFAPQAMEGSFVDADGARSQCDALFRVRLKTGQEARIYVLLEHKSYVDAATPLQILRYMIDIWQREIAGGAARDRLPAILPLVFYHGPGRWTVPRSVSEMIDAPEGLRDFAYVLHDLGEIEPLRLSRRPDVRAGLLALKIVHVEDIPGELLDLITGAPVAGSAFERHILRYIVERMNLTPEKLAASLRRTKPDRWEALMGTVAEAWIEQGRAEGVERGRVEGIERGRVEGIERGRIEGIERGRIEGIERGRVEGQAGIVLRLLELRFGPLPETARARVLGAPAAELEAWAEAVLEASSLDEVMTTGLKG